MTRRIRRMLGRVVSKRSMRRRLMALALATLAIGVLAAGVHIAQAAQPAPGRGVSSHNGQTTSRALWASDGAWFQRLIYLYASGDPALQRAARTAGAQAGLSAEQVAAISQAVRGAWVRLMRDDPASLGRVGARPNFAGQQAALHTLRATLQAITGPRYATFLSVTENAYRLTTSALWLASNQPNTSPAPIGPAQQTNIYMLVYATSFSIPGEPNTTQYVALPDVYLKYATLGQYSNIPAVYQPYYLRTPASNTLPYTVDIANASNVVVVKGVTTLDVGPWNEDDNWWDYLNPFTTPPTSCPVATSTLPGALDNAQVDGVCPGRHNWRRTAYYLLYQHGGLPFFQQASYAPTGPYTNGTNWPPALPYGCPEASLASVNDDGAACASGLRGYNGSNGAWLRDGTYNAPILNQAGIDLSPATDASLGWTWPSSGFIYVNVARLP